MMMFIEISVNLKFGKIKSFNTFFYLLLTNESLNKAKNIFSYYCTEKYQNF